MSYDEGLAERIREVLDSQEGVVEKKMFGGLAFMVRGHMCCGVSGDDLMLRVGPEQYDDALKQPHARAMDFTGRPMKGFVYIGQEGLASDEQLEEWVRRGLRFVQPLPPK
jgi:TfoX/Sxy family transcriptional regulator of competence genes